MDKLYKNILSKLDGEDLVRRTKELNRIDLGQTFKHYHLSCEHILSELKKYGIPNAEIIKVPADGKTVYQDKRMPIAWDATIGKLTLNDKEKTVAADYTVQPFNLIKGSCGVKKGGETMRIITEAQFLAGEDPTNALVMLETTTWPRAAVLTPILNMGGRGIITDFLNSARYDYPDAVQWVNACTEGNNWHVQCDDREFVGFSVSLRMGDKIRNLANKGSLSAFVECDGYRYEGELPAVTALVPGRKEEEVWILAHAFEPLLDDDSNGITAGIEIARQVMALGTPEYSLRLIFAMELYGYAAFHADFKGKVIGGCNIDSLPVCKNQACRMIPPIGPGTFHGVDILKKLSEGFDGCPEYMTKQPECFDDMFLSDSTTNVPTAWLLKYEKDVSFWHTSMQTEEDYLDAETFAKYTALAAVWTIETVFYKGEPAKAAELDVKLIDSPWRRYAAEQIFARNTVGYPQDLVNIPMAKRRPLSVIYNHMGSILARMDGVKNMAQLIAEAEAERQNTLTDKDIKKILSTCDYLAEYDYLKAVKRVAITSDMICDALKKLGIAENDVLLVHASISNCGYIEGGAETIIDSISKVIGADGAALFTAFTRPYVYLGGVNKMWLYAPYDEKDLSQIWTGNISKVLLEKYPEAIRSKHITHSWAGIGNKAGACLNPHGATDAPCGKTSPLAKALEMNGKILFFGSGVAPSTFIHHLETEVNANFLETAVCTVKNADGSIEHVTVPQHLPGHRDFYRSDAENCKFFKKAVENGLEIREVELGMGKLNMIDLKQFYEIGLPLMQENSDIILCDSDDCLFCKKYRKK